MSAPFSPDQIKQALQEIPGWELAEDGTQLLCEINFPDFRAAMAFLVRFAFECEEQNHHAEIYNVYKTVRLGLNTHNAGGRVTEKDFALARRVSELISTG